MHSSAKEHGVLLGVERIGIPWPGGGIMSGIRFASYGLPGYFMTHVFASHGYNQDRPRT